MGGPDNEQDTYRRTTKLLYAHTRDLWQFWLRYKKNRIAVIGLAIFISLIFVAVLAPFLSPSNPYEMRLELKYRMLAPSWEHLMGTDYFGRDVFSRVIWGTRISLFIGFACAGISALVGIFLGSIAGYFGGKLGSLIDRVLEIFLVIPRFFLILIIVAVFGGSIWNVMVIIGLTIWPSTARLVRAEFLSLKEWDFVMAARSTGASDVYIIFREILPNALHTAIVNGSLQVAAAILTEASLSFLGLGDPNVVSWGWILNEALRSFRNAPWVGIFPGLAISLTVMAFNLIGDGLNDALNPHLKER